MAIRSDEVVSCAGDRSPRDGDVDLEGDRALVERCQAGDRSAFDALYQRYHRRLYRYALQRLRSPHDAEDVVQETFARAWRALPRFSGERRFYPWLTVIASNLCVDTHRGRARTTPVEESRLHAVDLGSYDTEDAVLHEVDAAMVTTAFAKLNDRHRRVLAMREGSGWSYQRIADHEGVGVTAVETLLWRARQSLKREFASLAGPEGGLGSLAGLLAVLRLRVLGAASRPLRAVTSFLRHAGGGEGSAFTPVTIGTTVAAGMLAIGVGTGLLSGGTAPQAHPRPAVVAPAGSGRTGPVPATAASGTTAHPGSTGTGTASTSPGNTSAPTGPGSVSSSSGGGSAVSSGGTPSSARPGSSGPSGVAPVGSAVSGVGSGVSALGGALGSSGSSVTAPVGGAVSGVSVGGAVSGVGGAVSGVGSGVSALGGALGSSGSSVTAPVGGTVSGLGGAVSGLFG